MRFLLTPTLVCCTALLSAACTPDGDPDVIDDRVPRPLDDPFPYDERCDGFEGTPVTGATGWFVGDYRIIGEEVEGYEAWALLANPAWEATGEGFDCQLTYNVAGIVEPAENCSSCDYAISIDLLLNYDASTCHDRFIAAHDAPDSTKYNIRELSTGVTEVMFASDGRLIGTGESNGDQFNFISEPRCFFF